MYRPKYSILSSDPNQESLLRGTGDAAAWQTAQIYLIFGFFLLPGLLNPSSSSEGGETEEGTWTGLKPEWRTLRGTLHCGAAP